MRLQIIQARYWANMKGISNEDLDQACDDQEEIMQKSNSENSRLFSQVVS